MSYPVNFTDNVNKGSITVQDNSINTETSLQLPGKSLTSYGTVINTNFLHLLENFANNSSPSNPVEGQLWYDTTTGVDQLKVYDGAFWVAASGLKKSTTQPIASSSLTGDLWVDTTNQQLYLYSGSSWVLIGPEYSSGAATGPRFVTISGTDNVEYPVLMTYVNNIIISIVSYGEFTPKLTLPGFTTIKPGINLANIDTTGDGINNVKFYGTSEKSESLMVGVTAYAGSDFARLSANNIFTKSIRIADNSGVRIGETETFTASTDGSNALLKNLSTDGSIELRVNTQTTGIKITNTGNVGIKNINPQSALDVTGSIAASGPISVTDDTASTSVSTGALKVSGGVGISKAAYIGGDLTVSGTTSTLKDIVPDATGTRNIGTLEKKFNNIYASTIFGNVQGNFVGALSGIASSANKMTTATNFSIAGDVTSSAVVNFDGTGGTKTFNVSIDNSFITNKTLYTDVVKNNEEIILYNPTETGSKVSGSTQGIGVYKAKVSQITSLVPTFAVGMLMPYGGAVAPSGWHMCDGTSLSRSTYSALFSAIGTAYGFITSSTFNVPDTRGRNLLGLQGNAVRTSATDEDRAYDEVEAKSLGGTGGAQRRYLTKDQLPQHQHSLAGTDESNTQYYAVTSTTGVIEDSKSTLIDFAGAGESGRGRTETSNVAGLTNTTQTVNGVANLSVGNKFTTVSPFLTVNYIIYTGVTV